MPEPNFWIVDMEPEDIDFRPCLCGFFAGVLVGIVWSALAAI